MPAINLVCEHCLTENRWNIKTKMEALVFLIVLLFLAFSAKNNKFIRQFFHPSPEEIGNTGEKHVSNWLAGLDSESYLVINDMVIPDTHEGSGTTQIDHVVLSPYGIFVVETKNYAGWIFGEEKATNWCQVLQREKHRFQNPYRQNFKHIACLSDLTKLPWNKFISIVAFVGDCEFKTRDELPRSLVTCKRELLNYIHSFKEIRLRNESLVHIKTLLTQDVANQRQLLQNDHVSHVHAVMAQKTLMVELAGGKPPKCPYCGSTMLLRTARKGMSAGHKFWGCSRFPRCHGIIDGEKR